MYLLTDMLKDNKCTVVHRLARLPRAGLLLGILVFITACADSSISDLQNYVSDVKSKKGHIDPIPEFKPIEMFVYKSDGAKDPFKTWKSEVVPVSTAAADNSGPRPTADRVKEELEAFPLDTLRMMGILELKGTRWALVKASDGIVYRVKKGNYMGQNHGKILDVEDDKVVLREIVPNGLGGWEERSASLTLNME